MRQKKETILFLYLHTGGGHISAARALSQRIKELYPRRINTVLLDPVSPEQLFVKHLFKRGYRLASHVFSFFWIALYEFTKLYPVKRLWAILTTLTLKERIQKEILEKGITKIIVLHFLLVRASYRAVKELNLSIPVITIVLDPFSAHPIWFAVKQVPVIVLSKKVERECLEQHGYSRKKVFLFSVPLRTAFNAKTSPDEKKVMKKKHGFFEDKPIILFAGGGEGFPMGYEYIKAFLQSSLDLQVAIVCGNDAFLKWQVTTLAKRHKQKHVKAYGYIDFMYELMSMADVIVCKGGPATVMEVLILGKPPIVSRYVYGQEKGNVEYVVSRGVGYYINDPKAMVEQVRELVENPETYLKITGRIKKLSLKNGTDDICEFLAKFSNK